MVVFEPILPGFGGKFNLFAFVFALSLAGACVHWKEGTNFGLEIANGVPTPTFHT